MTPRRRLARSAVLLASLVAGSASPVVAQGGVAQACPDSTDTPDILAYYVGVAYRALKSDPSRQLPPPCLMAAIAQRPATHPDSTFAQALTLTDELLTHQGHDSGLLDTRLILLSRLKRFAEMPAAFDRLIAADSARGTLDAYKRVISASRRTADTTSMLHYLSAATRKFPSNSQLTAEYDVLRQAPRLHMLIDSVHRAMKADRSLTLGYASLASIYGNLGKPDSTLAYVKRGLIAGVPRPTMATSLRSLIGALLREAQIGDAPDLWEATLPIAFDIDSAMSTPESKYLVALSISRLAADRMDPLNFYLPTLRLGHGYPEMESIDVGRVPQSSGDEACPSIAAMIRLTDHASQRLTSGGDRFAPETVPAIVKGLDAMRQRLASLARGCGPRSAGVGPSLAE